MFDRGSHQVAFEEFVAKKNEAIPNLNLLLDNTTRSELWATIFPKLILLHHTQREYWTSLYVREIHIIYSRKECG